MAKDRSLVERSRICGSLIINKPCQLSFLSATGNGEFCYLSGAVETETAKYR